MQSLQGNTLIALIWMSALMVTMSVRAQSGAPAPPANLTTADRPNDKGDGIVLKWDLSPDDSPEITPRRVIRYEIQRRVGLQGEFKPIAEQTYGGNSFTDPNAKSGELHSYRIAAVGPDGAASAPVETVSGVSPEMEWFDTTRAWFGIFLVIICGAVIYYIGVAKRGRDLRIRKIAGLEAVDEAVGRATEMGRSILFVPGIQDINDIQTVAGITVLSRVAKTAAEHGAQVEVPTSRALVMTTARETVKAAFLAAGRPDAYNEDLIYYLTDEQFGYVAGVTGKMMREKPAACFYMGSFFAESLFLAETGNAIGAIQIAGTAQPSQLPFFVAACDYTLIGEEFFAASAYLSGEPHQLGSLKGQDMGKVVGTILLVLGCVLATLYSITDSPAIGRGVEFLKNNVLGEAGFLPEKDPGS
ncbi:MAG: fibronectin type III domain-containing protein [Phycisphaerales bacterium]|nr:fibronectin type III domain-containing protein [Phycisphaerales bacterium]